MVWGYLKKIWPELWIWHQLSLPTDYPIWKRDKNQGACEVISLDTCCAVTSMLEVSDTPKFNKHKCEIQMI